MIKLNTLCEQIERLLKAIISGDRRFPTRPEIAIHARQGLAYVIVGDAFNNSNVDGLMYADDVWNITLKGLAVNTDADGYKSSTLPNLPVTLPRNRGIVSVRPAGVLDRSYDIILRKDIDIVSGLTRNNVKRRVMCYQENTSICYYATGGGRVAAAVDATIVSAPVGGLDEILNVGEDIQSKIIQYVLKIYSMQGQKPESENTDGIDTV